MGEVWSQSLSIDDFEQSEITIHPNPTDGRIYLERDKTESIEVYSLEGKLLNRFTEFENYIDLNLSSGLYILKLLNGDKSIVKKLMVN